MSPPADRDLERWEVATYLSCLCLVPLPVPTIWPCLNIENDKFELKKIQIFMAFYKAIYFFQLFIYWVLDARVKLSNPKFYANVD